MEDISCPVPPVRKNPTALRLAEVLSAWLPDSPEGVYSQYLQSLSPQYDHLLTYSRYDQIWRFSENPDYKLRYRSHISLLTSPVHVIDVGDQATNHWSYDGTNPKSMETLRRQLVDETSKSEGSSRIICTQHLTCLSMEALGIGLSMDPDVFSHHIGMSFKEIEKSTSINKLCETNIGDIPTSIGLYERDKNLQICKRFLGPFQYANVNHAKDHTTRNSLLKSIYNQNSVPITISVEVPRTIYVQGYQEENDTTGVVGRNLQITPWVLQDHILNRRPARQRFADDSMLRDQGERYSQDGLDILQHITIHVTNDSRNPTNQQVLVLFPPSPELEGDNDVLIFLDSLRRKEHVQSFQEFCRKQEKASHESTDKQTSNRQPSSQDVEVFANDMLLPAEPQIPKGVESVLHLVRSYALNAWFDRIQSLESQLQDLNVDSFREHMQDYESSDESNRQLKRDGEHRMSYGKPDEKWMTTAILRYISSLENECHRLRVDLQAAEKSKSDSLSSLSEMSDKYAYIHSRMNSFLAQTQHSLAMKTNKMQNDLTKLHIKESRKSAREAAKLKRMLLQDRPPRAARLPSPGDSREYSKSWRLPINIALHGPRNLHRVRSFL